MSAEQAESAPEGSFAVLRAGRHGLPVFCGEYRSALRDIEDAVGRERWNPYP